MLIKFTGGGRGSGAQVADYLTDPERVGRDHAPPEVLRGDMARTRDLIDSIARQWSYTHGVLSFALEDAPTEAQQHEAMDAFEALAFAGFDREQYDITWVRHQHTEGARVELHFVVPRMELVSGKALNIAPPGWEHTYAPLRDALNWGHGWARPDDPERARELQGASERLREGLRGREGREALHGFLSGLVASEQVTDRGSMVAALEEAGLEVPRQGQDYVTVRDPDSGDRWRLKGRIYEKDWSYDRELERAAAKEAGEPVGRDRGNDGERAAAARIELEERMRRRAEFHAERYPRDSGSAGREPDAVEELRSLVVGGADRDVAGDRGLVGLALSAGESRADGSVHERGRGNVSDPARRGRGGELYEGRVSVPVHPVTGGEIDHGSVDRFRAGFARTVRDIGAGLRDLTETVRGYGAGLVGAVRRVWGAGAQDRGASERFERSLAGLGWALDGADAAGERLDRCCEQVAGRVLDIERAAARERDRGMDYGL